MNNPPIAWLLYFELRLGAKTTPAREQGRIALKEGVLLPLARKRIWRQYIQQQKGWRHDVSPTL
jgi:hypothetical protein